MAQAASPAIAGRLPITSRVIRGAFDIRDPARLDFHFQSEARSAFRVTPSTGNAGSGIFA